MSRMINDPAYAMYVATGHDPVTGVTDPGTGAQRFAREALAMHERTNAGTDRDGDRQLPWPRSWGTQPWALANEMSAAGGSGVPGTTYRVHAVRLENRGSSFDRDRRGEPGRAHGPGLRRQPPATGPHRAGHRDRRREPHRLPARRGPDGARHP